MPGFAQEQRVVGGERVDHGDQRFAGFVGDHHVVISAKGGQPLQLAQLFAQAARDQLMLGGGEVQSANFS